MESLRFTCRACADPAQGTRRGSRCPGRAGLTYVDEAMTWSVSNELHDGDGRQVEFNSVGWLVIGLDSHYQQSVIYVIS